MSPPHSYIYIVVKTGITLELELTGKTGYVGAEDADAKKGELP